MVDKEIAICIKTRSVLIQNARRFHTKRIPFWVKFVYRTLGHVERSVIEGVFAESSIISICPLTYLAIALLS